MAGFFGRYRYLFILLGFVALSVLLSFVLQAQFGEKITEEGIKNYIASFGLFGPLVLVALIMAEVIVAPLPGGLLPIVSGALFGPGLGILYSWVGNVLGSIIVFLLVRAYGERAVRFFAPAFDRKKYDSAMQRGRAYIWLLYAFPIAAADVLSFALGLTTMPLGTFITIIGSAFLVRMAIWNTFGYALIALW